MSEQQQLYPPGTRVQVKKNGPKSQRGMVGEVVRYGREVKYDYQRTHILVQFDGEVVNYWFPADEIHPALELPQ